jgi:hypothetical protein
MKQAEYEQLKNYIIRIQEELNKSNSGLIEAGSLLAQIVGMIPTSVYNKTQTVPPYFLENDAKKEEKKNNWRDLPPSEKQLDYLNYLGYNGDPPATKGAASDLITALKGGKS